MVESDDKSVKDLEAQLAEARKRRNEAEAKRRDHFRRDDLVRDLTDELVRAEDEERLLDLEREHGREGIAIAKIGTERNGMVVVRKPNHLAYSRFVDKGKHDRVSLEKLVFDHLLYPDRAKFESILQDEFDTLRKCSNALSFLHGLNLREELPGK